MTRTARLWQSVNRIARSRYRQLLVRHPGFARWLKRALFPVLIATNRRLLRQDYVALFTTPVDAGLRGRFQARLDETPPLVSVVVQSWNHARHLPRLLDSVAAQGWPNLEIILIDDASTDGSDVILRDFAALHGARLIVNQQNSGSVYGIWRQAMAEAQGEVIWIAQSDDWVDPGFLARLVPWFANPAVRLAFGRAVFMDETGTAQIGAMEDQLGEVAPDIYAAPFLLTDAEIVARGFGRVNLIPNVTGALFRRPGDPALLGGWADLPTAGDWLLYLELMRGGMVAYDPGAISYFRNDGGNASVKAHGRDGFYAEHEVVAAHVARHYGVEAADGEAQARRLHRLWAAARDDDPAGLARLFDPARVQAVPRALRILMAGAGFAPGGGETFAIGLANLLRAQGQTVTFLDCGLEPEEPAMRARLSRDVPLVTDPSALAAILSDFAVDVVHSHYAWVDQAVLDAVPPGVAAVVTLHGMYETLPEAQRARLLDRLDREAAALTATADRNMAGLPAGRVVRIANAVAAVPAAPVSRAELGVPDGAFLITILSRAVEEKGWAEAIEATAAARRSSGADIHLLLVGSGPVHERLQAQGVPGFVHLAGFRADAAAVFAASDLSLLPSRYAGESAPLALLESLAAGTPVIASDLGEIRSMLLAPAVAAGEVIALRDGAIDIAAWADVIAALATDPARLDALRAAIPALLPADAAQYMAQAFLGVYAEAKARNLIGEPA